MYLLAKKTVSIILLCGLYFSLPACAIITGEEDSGAVLSGPPLPNLRFVESLANRESLRGESYRELTAGNASPGSLNRPSSVYADQFRVYVTDAAPPGRVFIFDRTEGALTVLNLQPIFNSVEGSPLTPSGIVVDLAGIIYVSDQQQGKVFGFDRNGKLHLVLGNPQVVNSRTGLGELLSPAGLAFQPAQNRLYVADLHGHQIQVYDTVGSHLFEMGRAGRDGSNFTFPSSVAIDLAGNVYVLDSLRLRVYVFTPEGGFVRSFSLKNDLIPKLSARPGGIAVDSSGYVYITDTVFNTILIFDSAGTYIANWGRTGKLFGDFWSPAGIFIDGRDYVYIADQMNSRIQVFQHVQ